MGNQFPGERSSHYPLSFTSEVGLKGAKGGGGERLGFWKGLAKGQGGLFDPGGRQSATVSVRRVTMDKEEWKGRRTAEKKGRQEVGVVVGGRDGGEEHEA